MEQRFKQFWLITQNVDGLHRDAGSRQLSEIHGNIWKVPLHPMPGHCRQSGRTIAMLPLCGSCGGLLRPHIVWFGESLAEEDLDGSAAALEQRCLLDRRYIRGWSIRRRDSAHRQTGGRVYLEINLDATPHSDLADATLQGVRDIVPLLLEA